MIAVISLIAMYLFAVPLAFLAFRQGRKVLARKDPPEGPVRSTQLGRLVTDPAEKLAASRQIGWMWIFAGIALLAGPLLTLVPK